MLLQREGRIVDEDTYVKTTEAMQKMKKVADKLISLTPEIGKFLPQNSLLRTLRTDVLASLKNGTPINNVMKPPIIESNDAREYNSTQVRQKAALLQIELDTLRREKAEYLNDLEIKKDRYVCRELEYRRVINELAQDITVNTALDIGDAKKMEAATKHHVDIQGQVGKYQLKTSQVLVGQEKTVISYFKEKVAEIKNEFKEERIRQGKKDQDLMLRENQLIQELDWVQNMAQQIDNENIEVMKRFMRLQAKYQTQENDRDMLLRELIMKKKENVLLKQKIESCEESLGKLDEEAKDGGDTKHKLNRTRNSSFADTLPGIDASAGRTQYSAKKNAMNESFTVVQTRPRSSSNWVMKKYQSQKPQSANSSFRSTSKQGGQSMYGQDQLAQNQRMIQELKGKLMEESRQIREWKSLYVQSMVEKAQLEKTIRHCVEDIKESIIQERGQRRVQQANNSNMGSSLNDEADKQIDKLIGNEKILTLIYDKTFYPEPKQLPLDKLSSVVAADSEHITACIHASRLQNEENASHINELKCLADDIDFLS